MMQFYAGKYFKYERFEVYLKIQPIKKMKKTKCFISFQIITIVYTYNIFCLCINLHLIFHLK